MSTLESSPKGSSAKNRLFYSLPEENILANDANNKEKEALFTYINDNVIGKDTSFSGPFGLRKVTYLDFTASARALSFIEDYIRNEVLPEYGNTHTTTSVTSLQTTLYRHEARDIIRNAVHASEHDAVIFVGSGCTAAVHKLIHALDLTTPPIVFVGPYEHHSNLLPWRECGAKVIRVREDDSGLVDIKQLEHLLQEYKCCGHQMIGCFSAASNITGILTDVDTVTVCLHRHGALALWDYATAAPYVKVDMNPVIACADQPLIYKDAVFISPHKFVGGVSTPGILIAKKKLFRNRVPDGCGGGTVFFVRRDGHRYLQEPEMKEEGGTPAIVEAIRAGMVFQLKEAVTANVIMKREHLLFRKAKESLEKQTGLVLLGNLDVPRLPIFSFLVYHSASGRFLHYNYVSTLLNDVFGIQARGGCACAGPYAMDQLGLAEETAIKIEELLAEDRRLDRTHLRRYKEYSDREILRPGFTRINLPYFLDDETLDFIFEALKLVAEHGWKLLPQYMFNPQTGEWRCKNFQTFKDRKWLGHISYSTGEMKYKVPPLTIKGQLPTDFQDCLDKARNLFKHAEKSKYTLTDHSLMFDEDSQPFRWFLLPSEASECLQGNSVTSDPTQLPFCPPCLRERLNLPLFMKHSDKLFVEYPDDCENPRRTPKKEPIILSTDEGFDSIHSFCSEMQEKAFDMIRENVLFPKSNRNIHNAGSQCTSCKDEANLEQVVVSHIETQTTAKDKVVCTVELDQPSRRTTNASEELSNCHDSQSDVFASIKNNKNCVSPVFRSVKYKQIEAENGDLPSVDNHGCDISMNEVVDGHTVESLPFFTTKTSDIETDADNNTKIIEKQPMTSKWFSPPKTIFSPFIQAIDEFNMVRDGDKILVCLSGGKDSLSLLHTIRQYQFYCRGKGMGFQFGAVTVDPQTPSYDPSSLKDYLASLNVPYFYEEQCILEMASNLPYECDSICSFCSRMKRGRLYACARREGYNVLALGQHLDDLSESFMMSFFHNGILRTMKAHYTVKEGDLRVIRPFVYVREKDLRMFAEKNKLPVIAENCPACFEAPKERHRTKQLLASQEILFPQIYNSMLAAMKPVMAINKTGINMREVLGTALTANDNDDDVNINI